MCGVKQKHHSLPSKLVHWLLPATVPVYDSLVLGELGIGVTGAAAYRQIITWEYGCARGLQPYADQILGAIPGLTLLAAIDNYL